MRAIFITTFAGEIETSSGIPPKSLEEDLLRKPVKTTELCAAVQKMSFVH
jgi:hypothetical protein